MRRPPIPGAPGLALLLALVAAVPAPPAGSPDAAAQSPDWPIRIERDSARAVASALRGDAPAARGTLDSLTRALEAAWGPGGRIRGRLVAGDVDPALRRPDSSEAIGRAALALAEAQRDTVLMLRAGRLLTRAAAGRGDLEGSRRLTLRMMGLARHSRRLAYVGLCEGHLGWIAWQRDDLGTAEALLVRALDDCSRGGSAYGVQRTWSVLGNVYAYSGRLDAGARCQARALALADSLGDGRGVTFALNDLAAIEQRRGAPERAYAHARRSTELLLARGDEREYLIGLVNLASFARELGRDAEVTDLVRRGVAFASAHGTLEHRAALLMLQSGVLADSGRIEPAKAIWRSVLSAEYTGERESQVGAACAWAAALVAADSLDQADALLAGFRRELPDQVAYRNLAELALAHAGVWRAQGRRADARSLVGRTLRRLGPVGDPTVTLELEATLARLLRESGDRPAANRAIEAATATWESLRGQAVDPEFREASGERAALLAQESVLAAWADSGASAAFDRLQRFRTRTLIERWSAPHRGMHSAIAPLAGRWPGAREFQRTVLRAGELELEYFVGPDTAMVFVVTRDTLRVAPLAHAAALALAGGARGPGAAWAQGAGRILLGPAAGELREASRVIVGPDQSLSGVPFAALVPPGGSAALSARMPVLWMPSAAMLATMRGGSSRPGGHVLTVLGGGHAGGGVLPGARAEVSGAAERYAGAERIGPGRDGVTPLHAADLARASVFHFAGHAVVNDARPWRSGLVLGPAGDRDSLLTADEVGGVATPARLVVLSGCESAGGRSRPGEGLAGLSSALLAGGARSVVGTLWPVEDRTAARFVERYLAEVARGATTGEALRGVQAAWASRPGSRAADWAAFVLVGDDVKVPGLRTRGGRRAAGWLAGVLLLAMAGALLAARTRRTRN